MASIRKRGRVFYYSFIDAEEKRRERKGCPDKRATEELALAAEVEVARIRAGLIDQRGLAYRDHAVSPLSDHIEAFKAHLEAKGSTTKHVGLTMQQLRRVFEAARIGRLADLSAEKVQAALKALRDEGLSSARLTATARPLADSRNGVTTRVGPESTNFAQCVASTPRKTVATIDGLSLLKSFDASSRSPTKAPHGGKWTALPVPFAIVWPWPPGYATRKFRASGPSRSTGPPIPTR